MKLLICAQAVDTQDPVLGFFVRWIEEFAKHVESIEVICLYRGAYNLPNNVRVHSLGKERGKLNRMVYTYRFFKFMWQLRRDYDAVFVHMNQEYVLLAGIFWRFLRKKVYLWRNHYEGSRLTDMAAAFCAKVFCTSKYSYTAKYKKTVFMPVGIDTDRYKPDARIPRVSHSILFLARIAPSKRVEMFIEALGLLAQQGVEFTATLIGSPLPEHAQYLAGLKAQVIQLSLNERVTFKPGVANGETPDIYRAHEIFVNTSPSGMLDKTILEAAACGCFVLAASKDIEEQVGHFAYVDSAHALAGALQEFWAISDNIDRKARLEALVAGHTLQKLGQKLYAIMADT